VGPVMIDITTRLFRAERICQGDLRCLSPA
jgi:hypothetical protein